MGNLTVRLPAGVSIVHATRLSGTLPPPGYAMTLRCAGLFRADQRLVADNPEREAHQDRGEGHQPRPLCRLPDGRGRHSEKSVRRHPAADRRTAVAAGHIDSVKRSVVTLSIKKLRETCVCRQQNSRFRCAALCRRVPTPVARMLAAAVRDCQEPPNVAEWV